MPMSSDISVEDLEKEQTQDAGSVSGELSFEEATPPPVQLEGDESEAAEIGGDDLAPPPVQSGSTDPVAVEVKEGAAPPPEEPPENKKRIGDLLVDRGVISDGQLKVALQEKRQSNKLLGEILVDLGFVTETTLSAFLAEKDDFGVYDPKSAVVDGALVKEIPRNVAERYQVLLVSLKEDAADVAMSDPYDVVALDTIRQHLPRGVNINPLVATPTVLNAAIDQAYGFASSIPEILKELEGEEIDTIDLANLSEEDAYSHPIVRLVNTLVSDAVKRGCSDLHFEPEENFVRLRNRLDGVLYTAQILHKKHWSGIVQRLKIMSNLNIAEKFKPQDGRFNLTFGAREADFRVSCLPTVHGENVVLRVLDKSSSIMPLEKLGFSPVNLDLILKSQARPEGIIIVTGPTGSGKSTSLYSMLNAINSVEKNIQTLEDPVEYSIPMIRQTHVREGVMEFADGIKALLRQDPDIIFIGEIRDETTAGMALKAAMTGHQVFTTLHTNDSFSAIPRLLDLKLKPGMIAGNIISCFAQRLLRRLCTECCIEREPTDEEKLILDLPEDDQRTILDKGPGCDECNGMGYKGRLAVAEILYMDEELDEIIANGGNKLDLKAKAVENGFCSMADDGVKKVLGNVTSLEALSRVISLDDRIIAVKKKRGMI